MFAIMTAAITFSTDWMGDIVGGVVCDVFNITEEDMSNFSHAMVFKLIAISLCFLLIFILPTK